MNIKSDIESDTDSEMLVADGLDEAILGVAHQCGSDPVVAYDISKIIKILMERDGMDKTEAIEFYQFNIEGAYMGNRTPYYIDTDPDAIELLKE